MRCEFKEASLADSVIIYEFINKHMPKFRSLDMIEDEFKNDNYRTYLLLSKEHTDEPLSELRKNKDKDNLKNLTNESTISISIELDSACVATDARLKGDNLHKRKILALINFYISEDYKDLNLILVDKNFRNLGLAKKLFLYSLEKLMDIYPDVRQLNLEVSEKNEAAIKLYRSLGFKEYMRRNNYYGNNIAAILMSYIY